MREQRSPKGQGLLRERVCVYESPLTTTNCLFLLGRTKQCFCRENLQICALRRDYFAVAESQPTPARLAWNGGGPLDLVQSVSNP